MDKKDITANLTLSYYIRSLNLKHKEVATYMDVEESTMSRMVHFKRPLKYSEVKRFCERAGVALGEFSRTEDMLREQSSDIERIVRAIGKGKVLIFIVFEILSKFRSP